MLRFPCSTVQWRQYQLIVLVLISLIVISIHLLKWMDEPQNWFWDLAVYQGAGAVAQSGADAYAQNYSGLRFVYAPIVLTAFSTLGAALTPLFLSLYAAILIFFMARVPNSLRISSLLMFGVLVSSDVVLRSIFTGNATIFLHLLIIVLWLMPRGRKTTINLLFVIAVSTILKPYFAAYFMLWWLADGKVSSSSYWAFISLIGVIATWGAQALLMPDAFNAFVTALDQQTGMSGSNADMGQGFYGIAFWVISDQSIAMAFHLSMSIGLISGWLFFLRPHLSGQGSAICRILCLTGPLVICLVINPRLKIYDMAAILLLCTHAGYLLGLDRLHFKPQPLIVLMSALLFVDIVDIPFFEHELMRAIKAFGTILLLLGMFILTVIARKNQSFVLIR